MEATSSQGVQQFQHLWQRGLVVLRARLGEGQGPWAAVDQITRVVLCDAHSARRGEWGCLPRGYISCGGVVVVGEMARDREIAYLVQWAPLTLDICHFLVPKSA